MKKIDAATIADELNQAYIALLQKSDRCRAWDDIEIRQLVFRSERLKQADQLAAYKFMGDLAAMCGDLVAVHEYFLKALDCENSIGTRHAYWIALGNAGAFRDARAIGSELLTPANGFIAKIWARVCDRGQILEVHRALPAASRTYPELLNIDLTNLTQLATVMRDRGLTDDEVIEILDLAGEVERAHKIMFAGPHATLPTVLRPADDLPYLHIGIPIDGSVQEIRKMNRDLVGLVVERAPGGRFPVGLVVAFEKHFSSELLAAA